MELPHNNVMPSPELSLLRYRWRKLLTDLHRAQVLLLSKGISGVSERLLPRSRVRQQISSTSRMVLAPTFTRELEGLASNAGTKAKILWIDEQLPDPSRDSGSLRMLNLMQVTLALGYRVDFLPSRSGHATALIDNLITIGVGSPLHAATAPRSANRWLQENAANYDCIILTRYHLAHTLLPLLRQCAPNARLILDTVDLHHLREQSEAKHSQSRTLSLTAQRTKNLELRAVAQADCTWVVSEEEADLLRNLLPEAWIEVASNVHSTAADIPGPEKRTGLLFVGGAKHPPNVDAVRWLIEEIMPALRQTQEPPQLHLVGSGLRELVRDGDEIADIHFHGQIASLDDLLSSCRAGLAPLRFGAGIKGKVNQYMAHGLPTLATSIAVEGMQLLAGEDVLIAENATQFCVAYEALSNTDLWLRLSAAGTRNIEQHFSIARAAEAINATFADIVHR